MEKKGTYSVPGWQLFNRTKDKILSVNDETDPLEIVTEINEYFVSIGPILSEQIGPANVELHFDNVPNVSLLSLNLTTPEEVIKLLYNIPDGKATGSDGMMERNARNI